MKKELHEFNLHYEFIVSLQIWIYYKDSKDLKISPSSRMSENSGCTYDHKNKLSESRNIIKYASRKNIL